MSFCANLWAQLDEALIVSVPILFVFWGHVVTIFSCFAEVWLTTHRVVNKTKAKHEKKETHFFY